MESKDSEPPGRFVGEAGAKSPDEVEVCRLCSVGMYGIEMIGYINDST
jgi:hypothetical protein